MRCLSLLFALVLALPAHAEQSAREGWAVMPTQKSYDALIAAVKGAARENGLGVVTEAGPTGVARSRGIDIPGNRVIGLFNNDFAVRILGMSPSAMIEAPIRMYVTENPDGTATLSYKLPSYVFSFYADEGGEALATVAAELDQLFASVAAAASE